VRAAQDALELEPCLLGDAARRDVLDVGPQLYARRTALL